MGRRIRRAGGERAGAGNARALVRVSRRTGARLQRRVPEHGKDDRGRGRRPAGAGRRSVRHLGGQHRRRGRRRDIGHRGRIPVSVRQRGRRVCDLDERRRHGERVLGVVCQGSRGRRSVRQRGGRHRRRGRRRGAGHRGGFPEKVTGTSARDNAQRRRHHKESGRGHLGAPEC